MKLSYQAQSHIGLVRSRNEDAYAVGGGLSDTNPGSLFVVCDGMGLGGAGEAAAQLASNTIIEVYYASEKLDRGAALIEAFYKANERVYQQVKPTSGWTTATAVLFVESKFYVAHVGTCRAYLFQEKRLRQISIDHTFVEDLIRRGVLTREEAHTHHVTHRILRAIGETDNIEVDSFSEVLKEDDAILICTDGLYGFVEDAEIERTIHENPLQDVVGHLIDQANARGGPDNATAILIWREE